MYKKVRNIISLVLISALMLLPFPTFANESPVPRFSDVPVGHWADKAVHDLRTLKITNGIGDNKFGLYLTITRSEFVAYLVRMMHWELIKPVVGSYIDNKNSTKWYYSYIETALKNGVISKNSNMFHPEDPITREDMSIMIVCSMGYDTLATQLTYPGSTFKDVVNNTGYITIARDFGIINGVGNNEFKPDDTATRAQAAVMMMRMYERLNQSISELHAFYAIHSVNQADMIKALDSVGFGWSRLEYNEENRQVILNTTRNNNNEYAVPDGFSEPFYKAQESKVNTELMISVKDDMILNADGKASISLLSYILINPEIRTQVIASIVKQVNATTKDGITISFGGVVIDFESMKGNLLKNSFNLFLQELKLELHKTVKRLYVAVPPTRKPGLLYYDGYDYKVIGEIADKVILMVHDYYAKNLTAEEMQNGYTITPLSPFDEIYYALKAITDKVTGVQDLNKIWVQISFDSVLWKLKEGKVINKYPYNLSYETIQKRLLTDATINYSNLNQNPYATYFDSSDETNNVLWYEDSRSVQAKIKLARMFGINGISLWRLGNIPDYEEINTKKIYFDVWQQILNNLP